MALRDAHDSRRGRYTVGLAAVAVAALALLVAPVGAQDETITIPMAEAYTDGAPGDSVPMGSADVAAELVGRTCNVVATATNGSSVHPGNVLVVSSGGSSVTISGIEDESGSVVTDGGTLTLGETISASVVLGEDGATSIGTTTVLTCEPLPEAPAPAPVPSEPDYTG